MTRAGLVLAEWEFMLGSLRPHVRPPFLRIDRHGATLIKSLRATRYVTSDVKVALAPEEYFLKG